MATKTNNDADKSCLCKKSKCLKLYCRCFHAELYCAEACGCKECFNLPDHEDKVQDARESTKKRNPLAFSPKIHSLEGGGKHRKGCVCKKTKCLKLNCDCFDAGRYCAEACCCEECFNLPDYQDTVQETRKRIEKRNPLAFSSKIHSLEGVEKHIKGCDCRKSMCMLEYCVCYKAKVGCWDHCRCEGCENLYGMKGGNGDTMGTSRRESDMDPLGQLEFVNQFMPQDINAGHMESVMNLPYSPSLGGSSNSDMMIGTSTRDSGMFHVDQLEFMNQCTTQDITATHSSSVINLPYNPSQAESLNSELMIGWDYDLDLPTFDQLEFMNQFTHQDFNVTHDDMKK